MSLAESEPHQERLQRSAVPLDQTISTSLPQETPRLCREYLFLRTENARASGKVAFRGIIGMVP